MQNQVETFQNQELARSIRSLQEKSIQINCFNVNMVEFNLNKLKEQRYILKQVCERWNNGNDHALYQKALSILASPMPITCVTKLKLNLSELQKELEFHMRNAYIEQETEDIYLWVHSCQSALKSVETEALELMQILREAIIQAQTLTSLVEDLRPPEWFTTSMNQFSSITNSSANATTSNFDSMHDMADNTTSVPNIETHLEQDKIVRADFCSISLS